MEQYATFEAVKTLIELQGESVNGKLDTIRLDVKRVEGKVDEIRAFDVTGSLTVSGGAATHTLTEAEMPSHTHGVSASTSGTDGTHGHTHNFACALNRLGPRTHNLGVRKQ